MLYKFLLSLLLIIIGTPVYSEIKMREYRDRVCYDGDTCYIIYESLPESLQKMSIRVLGIDTPEIKGNCNKEKELALEAREFANSVFKAAKNIEFKDLKWDKYGGRVLSNVYLDGKLYADLIIAKGLAKSYDGGKKISWCD